MKKTDACIQLARQMACRIWEHMRQQPLVSSATPIDVVIPIIRKDLDILPLCLEGIRQNVNQHVKSIYVVAPDDDDIKAFCQKEKVVFVDETKVLDMTPEELQLQIACPNGKMVDRSGWLFQQFLKLSGNIGTCDYYLTIDADHILISPHVFLTQQETPVFYMSDECNTAYYHNILRLTGIRYLSLFSYVDHKMLFSKQQLSYLRAQIESANPGKDWRQAILDSYDRTETSGFSEFELYGSYVRRKTLRPWRHLKLCYSALKDYSSLQRQYAPKYHSVTFPCYLKSK